MPIHLDCWSRWPKPKWLLACNPSICHTLCHGCLFFIWRNEDGGTRTVLPSIFKNTESANCPLWSCEYWIYLSCSVVDIFELLVDKQDLTDSFLKSFFEWEAVRFEVDNICKEEPFNCPACTPDMLAVSVDGNRKHYRFKNAASYSKLCITVFVLIRKHSSLMWTKKSQILSYHKLLSITNCCFFLLFF